MNTKILEDSESRKILFATCPLDGHINPLTGLAMHLASKGFEIAWYTSKIFSTKFERLGIKHFPFKIAKDINAANVDEIFPERKEIKDLVEKMNFDFINAFICRAPEYLNDIEEIRKEFDFDMVICDSYFTGIPLIKEKLKVPVISIGIIPLAEESINLAPHGTGLLPSENEEDLEIYKQMRNELSQIIFKPAIEAFNTILSDHSIIHRKTLMPDILIKHSDLYLQIGTPSFEYKRSDIGKNIRYIGALLPYNEFRNKATWFDERILSYTTIILVTQGIIENDFTKLIEPTLEAFKDSDILVIATTGGNNTEYLRNAYPQKNIIIEDFIPFDAIMPHINVFVTNGGYTGIIMSIINKVPIVAAGVHEGKNEVGARIGYFNCGINLNTETPSAIEIHKSVKKILSTSLYKKKIIKINNEMAKYDPINLCLKYISDLLQ
ncbi:nucleotide disphospho-sugar-binding domain-containing protein [Flavobacterium sp. MC2016-06]|jgi:MGT family glycosyltransferase|uniref:glycosyltransferase n=1 Tax=Flavobacterium sp. MC2016-06 TaxID=2676308 RepID=UPI0012BA9948|nr:nucleotide disphospho-sugar-binding domain-containing protein [Flavobacterium sp. MC2016-06]MBU3857766.1 hypothetical protein [Flavobacterium sp. MC2016-06]